MTASVVLGIGSLAAINVYTAGTRGRHMSRRKAAVVKLVSQRLDILNALGAGQLPNCSDAIKSCRTDLGELAPEKSPHNGYPCTQTVDETKLGDYQANDADGSIRLDTVVWQHPDETQRTESAMVMVSGCWLDSAGRVKAFSDQRMVLD